MYEGIYLLQEKKSINTNRYKLGRSYKLIQRIKTYPKKSKLHLIIFCKNSVDIENNMIELLSKKFLFVSDKRCEYFDGNINDIINEFENYFSKINSVFCKINVNSEIYTNTFNINDISYENTNIYNPINVDDTLINQINYFMCDVGIKHICKYCDYVTPKKESYDIHLTRPKHKQNVLKVKKEMKKIGENKDNININKITNKLDQIIINQNNLVKQNQEVLNENERLKKEIEFLKQLKK
jgi:hypothetical protein